MGMTTLTLRFLLILLLTSLSSGASDSSKRSFQRKAGSSINLSTLTTKRRACSFYFWDLPSAVLYKWYNHLLKDCVYEGRGGSKFVRIEPGSIMQLLFPHRNRFSYDRCVICGGTFKDHLTLWWSTHLYTPYDRYLDSQSKTSVITDETSGKKRHVFHRNYVFDSAAVQDESMSDSQRLKAIRKGLSARYPGQAEFEIREAGGIKFAVPRQKSESVLLSLVRSICLKGVENLIFMESINNES